MVADLLPELSGETWVASALLDELTVDLPAAGVDEELVSDTAEDKILQTVRSWVDSASPGGLRRFLCRTKQRNRWRMRFSIRSSVGSECRV